MMTSFLRVSIVLDFIKRSVSSAGSAQSGYFGNIALFNPLYNVACV